MKKILQKLRRHNARRNSQIALLVPRNTYKWTDADARWWKSILQNVHWAKVVSMCHGWLLDRIFNDVVSKDYVRGYQDCLADITRCQPDPQIDFEMERAPEYLSDTKEEMISVQMDEVEDEELVMMPLE